MKWLLRYALLSLAPLTASAANFATVDDLVGHEFSIEDHWTGQELAFKREAGAIVAVWRVLGSGVPVVSERTYPVEIRSRTQCVFTLEQKEKRAEVKIALGEDAGIKAYVDGIRIYIVEKKLSPPLRVTR